MYCYSISSYFIVYESFFAWLDLSHMKQEVVFDLETDWITHVCQDLLFSTARREDIQWDQGRDKLNNYISNVFYNIQRWKRR